MNVTARTYFAFRTCSECGKKFLFRYHRRHVILGSPLIVCKHCGAISTAQRRVEWYAYPYQWQIWVAPAILCIIPGFISEQPGEAVFNIPKALTGLCIGLILLTVNLLRIRKSKKRMKDPAYVQKLFEYGVITEFQRNYFLNQGK